MLTERNRFFRLRENAARVGLAALCVSCGAGLAPSQVVTRAPAQVGVISSDNGGEHVESVGFRLCQPHGPPLVVSVAHAARDEGSSIDFGAGPERLRLEVTCQVGDIAIYSVEPKGREPEPCLRMHSPWPDLSEMPALHWLIPDLIRASDIIRPVDGPVSVVMIEEWAEPAAVIEATLESGASGTPLLLHTGDVVGMAFGNFQQDGLVVVTPQGLIDECVQRVTLTQKRSSSHLCLWEGRIAEWGGND